MFKSATIRLYPSVGQQRQLWKMVDAYRFAFNWLLHLRKFLYEGGKVSLGIYSWSSDHPRWGAPGTRAEQLRNWPGFESSVASPAVTPEGAHGPAKKLVVSK